MLARNWLVLAAVLSAGTARAADLVEVTTDNFVVQAPTREAAKAVADAAERHRKAVAERWLGAAQPTWEKPCEIRVSLTPGPSGGATTFLYASDPATRPAIGGARMQLGGDLRHLLGNVLPHELAHVVLAHHYGKPLPRWADEGFAILRESAADQSVHDARCRDLVTEGRGIRLRVLFRMMDYPRDLMATYTQGHSVARFLVGPACREPVGGCFDAVACRVQMSRYLEFLRQGIDGNTAESWDAAALAVYGFASVEAMEEAWLAWLKKPGSVLTRGAASRSADPLAKDAAEGLIPALRVPGSGQPVPDMPR